MGTHCEHYWEQYWEQGGEQNIKTLKLEFVSFGF
jgi:hypothetical protein